MARPLQPVLLLALTLAACSEPSPPSAATPEASVTTAAHEHPEPTHEPATTGTATQPDAIAPPANAVQNEMRILEGVMREVLTMIANNQLAGIPDRIFSVHGARDATEKAISEKRYLPPRNDEGIEAFVATDRAFHDDLVRLVKAARANDLPGATGAYAAVVVGCTNCHQRFRFQPTTTP